MQPVSSIEIDLRYEYDTGGFFEQPGSKEAMRVCADFFENILTDSLSEINAAATGKVQNSWEARPKHPATGNTLILANLIVPADTLIIYLGGRDLSGGTAGLATSGFSVGGFTDFVDQVQSRGQAGVLTSPATDFGPWGGSITFDTMLDGGPRIWNFSITETEPGATNFVGVALHELCHLLGIGVSDSWKDLAPSGGIFSGEASRIANGGVEPRVTGDKGHWIGSSPGPYVLPAYGSFGTEHGYSQRVLMNATSRAGQPEIEVLTDLDIAGLIDVGWEVAVPAQGMTTEEFSNGDRLITIPTTSNFTYRVQRGNLVTPFSNLSDLIVGDGTLKTFVDENPPAMKGFYRFTISRQAAAGARAVRQARDPNQFRTFSDSWESVGCCQHE